MSYKEVANKMGKGWFILSLAQEKGIKIRTNLLYGTRKAVNTRIGYYRSTKGKHLDILIEIVNNWNSRITAGDPKLSNKEIYDIALQLLKLFNIHKNKTGKGLKKDTFYYFPFYGRDEDSFNVRYEEGIEIDKRVEGLSGRLDEFYGRVLKHIDTLFGRYTSPEEEKKIRRIPIILSDKRPSEMVHHDVGKWLKKQFELYGNDLTEERINDIVNRKIENVPIAGEFVSNNGNPYIMIYYTNINENDIQSYFAKAYLVLAHEYFHYFHYVFSQNFGKKSKEAKIVKESLAEVFAYDCLMANRNYNIKIDQILNDRYYWWKRRIGSSCPYAYAFYYFNRSNIVYFKVIDVLMLSKTNMNNAYLKIIK